MSSKFAVLDIALRLKNLAFFSMWTQALTVVVLSVLLFSDHALNVEAEITNTGFSFPSFPVDDGVLKARDAMFNPSVFSYDMTSKDDYCGRILYKDKVRMLDKASGKVASFSTSFTFSFHSVPNSTWHCGEGMAFTLVADPSKTLEDSKRYLYCSFDSDIFNAPNRVFAVRFDSSRESAPSLGYEKLSDGNIGVVIRDKAGKMSISQYNLCGTDVTQCKFFCAVKGEFSAWIDYDGAGQTLEVRFRSGSLTTGGKPAEPLIRVPELRLEDVLDDEMYVGFNAKTYWSASSIPRSEVHRISSWHFNGSGIVLDPSSSSTGSHEHPSLKVGVIAAAAFGSVLMGVVLVVIVFFVIRRPKYFTTGKPDDPEPPPPPIRNIREYTCDELRSLTKNFSELLSSGGFGDVFKGNSGERLFAVKRINRCNERAEESWISELKSLNQIRHRNLLELQGWGQCKDHLFLVFDFKVNLSLDKWLHPKSNKEPTEWHNLSWKVRWDILAGVASGLEYLHEGCGKCVLHRDIKPGNVMLDALFNPYLGDFGLARLVDHHDVQKSTLLAGTLGYMAPELLDGGGPSKETDVFAFGILVLEMVCGREPLRRKEGEQHVNYVDNKLLNAVWTAHGDRRIGTMVDRRLLDQSQVASNVMRRTLHLGLLCCHPDPGERPSMRKVKDWFWTGNMRKIVALPGRLPAKKPGQHFRFTPDSNPSLGVTPRLDTSASPSSIWTIPTPKLGSDSSVPSPPITQPPSRNPSRNWKPY